MLHQSEANKQKETARSAVAARLWVPGMLYTFRGRQEGEVEVCEIRLGDFPFPRSLGMSGYSPRAGLDPPTTQSEGGAGELPLPPSLSKHTSTNTRT